MPESDDLTAEALRSDDRLVVVEAPAGCGKTWQGASYAIEAAKGLRRGRVLVLAHTHAATDVFMHRTPNLRDRIEVRTIHSLMFEIATAYHRSLELPSEPAVWALSQGDGAFDAVAAKVVALLDTAPIIENMLAERYPVVICDEHQDASDDQHRLTMALHRAGAKLRIFGDPMQKLYGGNVGRKRVLADQQRWDALVASATVTRLRQPHRWNDAPALGEWILHARESLQGGNAVDLTQSLPSELRVIRAENVGQGKQYRLCPQGRQPVDAFVQEKAGLLVLCGQNETAQCVSSAFARRFPIWEGHTRKPLASLVTATVRDAGNASAIGIAVCVFLQEVTTGFTPKSHAEPLLKELASGCSAKRRGFLAGIQRMARQLLLHPDHHGVSHLLADFVDLTTSDPSFQKIHIDLATELREAIRLGAFDDADAGLMELNRRRTHARPMPPPKAISTVHKAKGLEQENVLIIPCDVRHFSTSIPARHKLYVALSRATKRLSLVIPQKDPSPLFLT